MDIPDVNDCLPYEKYDGVPKRDEISYINFNIASENQ